MIKHKKPFKTTFHNQFMNLLVSSTRPVQAVMATAGIAATLSLISASFNTTWTPFDQLADVINLSSIILLFITYCFLSLHSAFWDRRDTFNKTLKYVAASIGIFLWTVAVSSSFTYSADGLRMLHSMSFMYLIPLMADMWVLIQLLAGVERIEKRDGSNGSN